MRKSAPAICIIGLLTASMLGCIDHEGQLSLFLTTSSAVTNAQAGLGLPARQVNLEITSVEVLEPESRAFITLSRGSQIYELLGLSGRGALLALADSLTEGNYREVRLTLSTANSSVIDDRGRKQPLHIDPKTVTVPAVFTVVEDGSTEVLLDLDLVASLDLRANGNWVLRPVVRQAVAGTRF